MKNIPTHAVQLFKGTDTNLLKMLDPTGNAFVPGEELVPGSWLLIFADEPDKNRVVSAEEFDRDYDQKVSAYPVHFVKLNKNNRKKS